MWWYNELTECIFLLVLIWWIIYAFLISFSALFATSQTSNSLQILLKINDIKEKYVSICDLIFLATEVLSRKK